MFIASSNSVIIQIFQRPLNKSHSARVCNVRQKSQNHKGNLRVSLARTISQTLALLSHSIEPLVFRISQSYG